MVDTVNMDMMNHNRSVCWIRLWSAIGTRYLLESSSGATRSVANELHTFELRRLAIAIHALKTTE